MFFLTDGGSVMRCNLSEPFNNLKIGDSVTVSYFEANGDYVANEIDLMGHCLLLLPQERRHFSAFLFGSLHVKFRCIPAAYSSPYLKYHTAGEPLSILSMYFKGF